MIKDTQMSDFAVTHFYRCQDTKPTGINNEYEILKLKYFLQKLEQKLNLNLRKSTNVFSTNFFPIAPLSELTTDIF